jgi:hypothetical protein
VLLQNVRDVVSNKACCGLATACSDPSHDGLCGACVSHPIAAGASNDSTCLPCDPGTYSTSSGACRGMPCCICTADGLRPVCTSITVGVEGVWTARTTSAIKLGSTRLPMNLRLLTACEENRPQLEGTVLNGSRPERASARRLPSKAAYLPFQSSALTLPPASVVVAELRGSKPDGVTVTCRRVSSPLAQAKPLPCSAMLSRGKYSSQYGLLFPRLGRCPVRLSRYLCHVRLKGVVAVPFGEAPAGGLQWVR